MYCFDKMFKFNLSFFNPLAARDKISRSAEPVYFAEVSYFYK